MDTVVRNGDYIEIINQRQKTELHHRKKADNMFFHDSQLNTKPFDAKQALQHYKSIQPHASVLMQSQSPIQQRLQAIDELQTIKSQIASQGLNAEEAQAYRKQIEYIQSKLMSKKSQIRLLQVSQPVQAKNSFTLLQTQIKVNLPKNFLTDLQKIQSLVTSPQFSAAIQKFQKLQKIVGYLAGQETWSADQKTVYDFLQSFAKYDNLYDKLQSVLCSFQSLEFSLMGLQQTCKSFKEQERGLEGMLRTTQRMMQLVQKLK